jgi:uncharacterized membrane protein
VQQHLNTRPAFVAATTLGIGMGGFFDGVVFHQILQLHNMLSARIAPTTLGGAKINMVWDGVFHAAVWLVTLLGIVLLWRAARRGDVRFDNRALVGGGLLGWGLFNVVEGMIDHHLLNLHHVYEIYGLSVWDYAFLGWGLAMIAVGWLLGRAASGAPSSAPSRR